MSLFIIEKDYIFIMPTTIINNVVIEYCNNAEKTKKTAT